MYTLLGPELEDLVDGGHRHHECLGTAEEREHVDDRDRHGNDQPERRAGTELRVEVELAAELVDDDPLHDVHAETAAARRGRYVARRKAGCREHFEQAAVVIDPAVHAPRDRGAVDTATVVADA